MHDLRLVLRISAGIRREQLSHMMQCYSLEPSSCPAYILSGGQSSRFGSDKALVSIADQPQLLRLHQTLQGWGHSTHVIADRPDRYLELGLNCLVDVEFACGPLAGLAAAMQHRLATGGAGWLLLVSCDQVVWLSEWWTQLSSAIEYNTQAVTFADADADAGQAIRSQPIPGLYHTQLAEMVARSLSAKQLSIRSLLSQVPVVALSTLNNPRSWSFNCPDELAAIQGRLIEVE